MTNDTERRLTRLENDRDALYETVETHRKETRADFRTMRTYVDKRFDAVDKRFDAVDKRFDAVDKRFDAVDKRFDAVDKRFDGIEAKLDLLTQRFDATLDLLARRELDSA